MLPIVLENVIELLEDIFSYIECTLIMKGSCLGCPYVHPRCTRNRVMLGMSIRVSKTTTFGHVQTIEKLSGVFGHVVETIYRCLFVEEKYNNFLVKEVHSSYNTIFQDLIATKSLFTRTYISPFALVVCHFGKETDHHES